MFQFVDDLTNAHDSLRSLRAKPELLLTISGTTSNVLFERSAHLLSIDTVNVFQQSVATKYSLSDITSPSVCNVL